MPRPRSVTIPVPDVSESVSGLLMLPPKPRALYVLAHGAGAGMTHAFMEATVAALAERRIATLRYQFPYMEKGSRRPDRQPKLVATIRAAVAAAATLAPKLPLFAGGKSMGGRMTSLAASETALPGVRGLVFLGFPLHAPGKPSSHRAEHLAAVSVPMLFIQGDRDKLADLDHLRPVCRKLGRRAKLVIIEGGDHSFHVLKRSGRTDEEAAGELTGAACEWMLELLAAKKKQ